MSGAETVCTTSSAQRYGAATRYATAGRRQRSSTSRPRRQTPVESHDSIWQYRDCWRAASVPFSRREQGQ